MKRFALFVFLFTILSGYGQDAAHNWTVQIYAEVSDDPAEITLKWLPNSTPAEDYLIWKKLKGTIGWGTNIATIPVEDPLEYVDNDVLLGVSYEYMIQLRGGGTVYAWSYINAGIQTKLNPNKGDLLLLVDERHADGLAVEIEILEYDMYTDGWMVTTVVVDSMDSAAEVKAEIMSQFEALDNLAGLYILGHVAVPYSGDLYPDFSYYHKGAWPADVYYGILFGEWTDTEVNITTATDPRNDNVPGDGKFDQSIVPATVNLQVSRVDFYGLPIFDESEEDLLRGYLNKAHEFKMADYIPTDRGLIDQGDLSFAAEGFAQNGYRNFTAFFGPDEVYDLDYWTTLNGNDYLWSFGCGTGSFSSANGLNGGATLSSFHIADGNSESTFNMFYGSSFGDWDTPNNIMRSIMASGRTLSCSWAGRPNFYYQHMAQGENIGYSAQISQDLYSDYFSLTVGAYITGEGVHVAQLGDPTLRMYYVSPPSDVTAENEGVSALISWTASSDPDVEGYNVYRRESDGIWSKVNNDLIVGTSFSDETVPGAGDFIWLVKAVKLKSNASGSFYNESHGREAAATFVVGLKEIADLTFDVYPNPNGGDFSIIASTPIDYLVIYSSDGKRVYDSSPNSSTVDLSLTDLAAGVYHIELKSGDQNHIERFIVK